MKVPLVPEIPLVSVPSVRDDDRRARKSDVVIKAMSLLLRPTYYHRPFMQDHLIVLMTYLHGEHPLCETIQRMGIR